MAAGCGEATRHQEFAFKIRRKHKHKVNVYHIWLVRLFVKILPFQHPPRPSGSLGHPHPPLSEIEL